VDESRVAMRCASRCVTLKVGTRRWSGEEVFLSSICGAVLVNEITYILLITTMSIFLFLLVVCPYVVTVTTCYEKIH
jgi:hypothetical protein